MDPVLAGARRGPTGNPARDEEAPPPEPELPVTISQIPQATTEPLTPPPATLPEPEPDHCRRPNRPAPPLCVGAVHLAVNEPHPGLERGETVVGDGASIEGTIRAERSIRVRGSVQGEIESGARIVVEEAASVKAESSRSRSRFWAR